MHVPEGPVRSVKDFLIHIVIVTIGILIAIGLEQLVEAHHRAQRMHDAVDGFQKELVYDESQLDEVMTAMVELRRQIDSEIANLNDPAPRSIRYPSINYDSISLASWDAAMATQALAELPYEDVHRYAEAFDLLRLFGSIEREGLTDWQDVRAYGDDPKAVTPDQRRALIERLRRYENFTYTLELVGRGAKQACEIALKKVAADHA